MIPIFLTTFPAFVDCAPWCTRGLVVFRSQSVFVRHLVTQSTRKKSFRQRDQFRREFIPFYGTTLRSVNSSPRPRPIRSGKNTKLSAVRRPRQKKTRYQSCTKTDISRTVCSSIVVVIEVVTSYYVYSSARSHTSVWRDVVVYVNRVYALWTLGDHRFLVSSDTAILTRSFNNLVVGLCTNFNIVFWRRKSLFARF